MYSSGHFNLHSDLRILINLNILKITRVKFAINKPHLLITRNSVLSLL